MTTHEHKKLNALIEIVDKLELIRQQLVELNQEIKGKEVIDKIVRTADYSVTLNPLFRAIETNEYETPIYNAVEEQDTTIKVIDEIKEKQSPHFFTDADLEFEVE